MLTIAQFCKYITNHWIAQLWVNCWYVNCNKDSNTFKATGDPIPVASLSFSQLLYPLTATTPIRSSAWPKTVESVLALGLSSFPPDIHVNSWSKVSASTWPLNSGCLDHFIYYIAASTPHPPSIPFPDLLTQDIPPSVCMTDFLLGSLPLYNVVPSSQLSESFSAVPVKHSKSNTTN